MRFKETCSSFTWKLLRSILYRKGYLMTHINGVDLKKILFFSCSVCGALFAQRSNLYEHVRRRHAKLRLYKCDECEKSYSWRNIPELHISVTHLHKRPFSCSHNRCSLAYNYQLYRHIRTMPPLCKECGKQFSDLHSLQWHINIVHLRKINYSFSQRGASFADKCPLKHHCLTVHVLYYNLSFSLQKAKISDIQ